jgi:hypothetical protein
VKQFEQIPIVKELLEIGHGRLELVIADNHIVTITPSPRYVMPSRVNYKNENTSVSNG